MQKSAFTLLFIFFFLASGFSQVILSENALSLKSNLNERRESIPLVDNTNTTVSLFIVDRKNLYFNRYDSSFELINQQKFERPKSQIKNFIEKVNPSEHEYLFLLSNDTQKKFELLKINTKDKKTELISKSILSNKEHYLKTFTYNKQICILSVVRKTSKLNIHKIDHNGTIETTNYDLTKEVFFNKLDKVVPLYKAFILYKPGAIRSTFGLEHIKTDIPNSLESTSKLVKLYQQDNRITISIDNNTKHTQIVTLNLDTPTFEVQTLSKPILENINKNNTLFVRSNSFLSKNRLYQIVGIKGQMKFNAIDLQSKEQIKELVLGKKDSITFKNTPIVQEGGVYNGYREMEKTQKFLRKIASGNIGIAIHHIQDTIQITLGGVKEVPSGVPMIGFGAIGGIAAAATNAFMTPTYYAYNGYSNTRSTYIHCLFDEDLTHLLGDVPFNAFDKIKEHSKDFLNQKAETVFKFNGYYVYGYYDSLEKKYFLRKFED